MVQFRLHLVDQMVIIDGCRLNAVLSAFIHGPWEYTQIWIDFTCVNTDFNQANMVSPSQN